MAAPTGLCVVCCLNLSCRFCFVLLINNNDAGHQSELMLCISLITEIACGHDTIPFFSFEAKLRRAVHSSGPVEESACAFETLALICVSDGRS